MPKPLTVWITADCGEFLKRWEYQTTGEGNGNPLQYSCLESPVDRGAWWAAVHRVAQSWTRLKQLSMARHIVDLQAFLVAQMVKNLPAVQKTWV